MSRNAVAAVTIVFVGCAHAQSRQSDSASSSSQAETQRSRSASRPIVELARVDVAIPTPASAIGHEVGAQAVRYENMERYLHQLAESSPLVTLTEYAVTHEGRKLYYLTITSEANHRRLADIKASNARLADPRNRGGGPAIATENLPAVAWMAYSIHGDELSGCDAAMLVAFHLAAGQDDATIRMRDEVVVLIDPLQNPDGRERYLSQLQTLQGKIPVHDYQALQHSGLWSAGRGNHYLFDLNRDWLPQVHPETRGRANAMHEWNPHLLIDAHEMGGLSTYLFDPPREPFNPMESGRNLHWRKVFSADQAAAFDKHGWSYYTQEWYEEWYPGYTNAWANLNGTIGLLYEQGGVNNDGVRQDSGEVVTYRDAVQRQYVSSMANLATLVKHRKAIVDDFAADRTWCVSGDGPHDEVFVLPPTRDLSRRNRLLDLLKQNGIEYSFAGAAFEGRQVTSMFRTTDDTRTFPPGSVVVRSQQPHRRMMHAILSFDPRMSDSYLKWEREEIERRRDSLIYDVTAWNVAMSYGLEAFWAKSIGEAALTDRDPLAARGAPAPQAAAYGYVIDGADSESLVVAARLLQEGYKVRAASKPFKLGEREFPRGSLLLRGHENPTSLSAVMREISETTQPEIIAANTALTSNGWDLGGERFHLLHLPRVAIASQWPTSTTSFGAHWHGLDHRLGLRVSPINIQEIDNIDLRAYNTLILPDSFAMDAVMQGGALAKLRAWVRSGGTLICIGDSAAFAADAGNDLSRVRLRSDVIEKLDEYEEEVGREHAAQKVEIDPAAVWGDPIHPVAETAAPDANAKQDIASNGAAANGADDKPKATEEKPKEKEALKREDEWRSMFSPRGVFVRAVADEEHWLCFGVPRDLPVLYGGSAVYMSKHPVQTAVRLADADTMRLSGLLWPEARARMSHGAYATVERVGNGQIVLFANDPFFRGYTEATGRLFFNAVVLGPGMGTSQPLPW